MLFQVVCLLLCIMSCGCSCYLWNMLNACVSCDPMSTYNLCFLEEITEISILFSWSISEDLVQFSTVPIAAITIFTLSIQTAQLLIILVLKSEQKQFTASLSGSVGYAVRLETRRLRVQPPPRSATFFRGD